MPKEAWVIMILIAALGFLGFVNIGAMSIRCSKCGKPVFDVGQIPWPNDLCSGCGQDLKVGD